MPRWNSTGGASARAFNPRRLVLVVTRLLVGGGGGGGGNDGSAFPGGGGGGGEVLSNIALIPVGVPQAIVVGLGDQDTTAPGIVARRGGGGQSGGIGGFGGDSGNQTPGNADGTGSGAGGAGPGGPTHQGGLVNSITGAAVTYGTGAIGGSSFPTNGAANSGNGGVGTPGPGGHVPGLGGSGVVYYWYPGAARATGGIITTVGGGTLHAFTASGTFTVL